MLKKPAQRKPAKGNGAPQTAYPVSAAFNRMLLCASLSLSLRVKQEKGCTRGKSLWNVYFAVFAKKKKRFVFACVCVCVSICFQQGGNYVKVRIRSRRQDCSPKTSTCRRGQRRYHYHRGHYHRRINRQINFFFFLISKCLRTYLHSGHQVPPFQVWWEYCEKTRH